MAKGRAKSIVLNPSMSPGGGPYSMALKTLKGHNPWKLQMTGA